MLNSSTLSSPFPLLCHAPLFGGAQGIQRPEAGGLEETGNGQGAGGLGTSGGVWTGLRGWKGLGMGD